MDKKNRTEKLIRKLNKDNLGEFIRYLVETQDTQDSVKPPVSFQQEEPQVKI